MVLHAAQARPGSAMKLAVCALLALSLLLAAAPGAAAQKRVRKELRSLTDKQYRALIMGLSTMNTVPTDAGRRLFGPKYISYMELMMKHAVAVKDPRGDQGHRGPCFMTFHRSWLLELEGSLLTIVPELKALPYWDVTLDNVGAKYHRTADYIFGEKYAGFLDGNNTVEYGVTTGVFGWRQVQQFVPAQFPQWASIFSGNPDGFIRSATNLNNRTLVTRFPTENMLGETTNKTGTFLPVMFGNQNATVLWDHLYEFRGKYGLNYPEKDYQRCLDPKNYTTWMEWNYCCDYMSIFTAPNQTEEFLDKYIGPEAGITSLLHPGMHWGVGSIADQTATTVGDCYDVSTSPNEMLLFFAHHANIDRSSLTWMTRAAKNDKSMEASSWKYPATQEEYPSAVPGCLLGDVVNSNAAFTTIFKTPPKNPAGYTHDEVLHLGSPLNPKAPYTYDTLRRG